MNKGAKAPVPKISKDIFIEETIIRADKYYRISDAFTFTPTMEKNMIVTRKPTGEEWMDRKNGIDHENIQDSYSIYKAAMGKKNPWPVTSSQEIGWDSMPLVDIYGTRFNHPKIRTKVTELFLGAKKNTAVTNLPEKKK